MFTVWAFCLIASVFSQDMETTTNVTTLYPTNKTVIRNITDSKGLKVSSQTWKLEAVLSKSNFTKKDVNNSDSKEEKEMDKEMGKGMDKEIKEDINEFKPSVHLGSFFDEDDAEIIDKPIDTPVYKQPPSGFVSSIKNEYQPAFNQIQKENQKHKELPYKFEDAYYSTGNLDCCVDSIDSKPTVEAPTRIPAGGLYKFPGAFKEKPTSDEKFDLDVIDNEKELALRRRVSPWKSVLRLVTAFIPVGLIISALTPSVITIHNVDNKRNQGIARRSDTAINNLLPISEQCRRRLLCEIHSDRYYVSTTSTSHRSKKHCYKLHCEDTEALWKMLRWLFTYNQSEDEHNNKYIT